MNVVEIVLTSVVSGVASFVVGGVLSWLITKKKQITAVEKAEQEGMKELLRSKLIDYHDKYIPRKYCPIYVKESATRSYEAYHDLGGNGTITQLYNELMALPTSLKKESK